MKKLLAVVALLAASGSAFAADQLLPGKRLLMRTATTGAQRLVLLVRTPGVVSPTPNGADDPRMGGATLLVRADSGESASLELPGPHWSANATGTVFKFRPPTAPAPPSSVKLAIVKGGRVLKLVSRSLGITLDEEFQGRVALQLTSGPTRYCVSFGGEVTRDQPGRFMARNAPPPGFCPTPPPTTSTTSTLGSSTTSTSSSTTTSTLIIPPFCGNGTIDPGEECDPPGPLCGGLPCNADCSCACDPLDASVCLYPFPNDYFTRLDASTDTGRRVNFSVAAMPRNASQKPIDPADYNRNDGFSPGASVVLRVPNLDLVQTGAAPITDVERSLDPGAPIVIVNASTLEHHLFWAELDANAGTEANRALILRPAINLKEGTRYIVALRRLKDGSGATITPGAEFLAYRDSIPTGDPAKEARRPHFEDLFTTLAAAGVGRSDLYLAWDFTVASKRNISERLLFIRDDAFASLAAASPTFLVTQVENEVDSRIFRRVTGQFLVPRYMSTPAPGSRYVLGLDGLPIRQPGDQQANFICTIPRAALANAAATAVPARPSLYGHGLLGGANEVNAGNVKDMGNTHNFVFCATDWIGMATADVPNVATILVDLSNFPTLTDRVQQSVLNMLFLARLMIHPSGFASDLNFRDLLGNSVINPTAVFYDGNSQGGIFGGTVMAVAQDITRGVLGVPAMNYSTLLTRSVDFDQYSIVLYASYQNELERPLLFALIQMLWDRSDPNGYAHHITSDPYANTPAHQVLLHEAFGDHQVTNVATEVEARTIGARIYQPALAPGRHSDVNPYFGIPTIPSFPFAGSTLVVWDSGTPTPPTQNVPNTGGSDPHGKPRGNANARLQKSEFLKIGGGVVDVCGGAPCVAP